MNRFLRFLYWARIVDETGVFSLTYAFVFVSLVVYAIERDAVTASVAAAAIANYAATKKVLPFFQQKLAAGHADAALARDHALKVVEASAETKKTQELVKALAEKVRELATPERLEALRNAAGPVGGVRPGPRLPVVPSRL